MWRSLTLWVQIPLVVFWRRALQSRLQSCVIRHRYVSYLNILVGKVAEWLKATDCKSVELLLRRFESCLSHYYFFARSAAKQPLLNAALQRSAQLPELMSKFDIGAKRYSAATKRSSAAKKKKHFVFVCNL